MTQRLFNHILFGTDFSSSSTTALPYAVAIAHHFAAKLYLAYVIPDDAYDLIPAGERDSALENMQRHVEDRWLGCEQPRFFKAYHTSCSWITGTFGR